MLLSTKQSKSSELSETYLPLLNKACDDKLYSKQMQSLQWIKKE